MTTPTAILPDEEFVASDTALPPRSPFVATSLIALVVITAVLVIVGLVMNDGHFLYVFDDTAIHMSMARQLADHGTWGVTAHHYASASSSPGWTLLLTAFSFLFPFARDVLPLLLNLAAAAWILVLIGRHQTLLRFRRHEWLPITVTVFCVAILWFLPGLALAGMEHLAHTALVLVALILVDRLVHDEYSAKTVRQLLLVLALATTVRFETAFIAAGIAVALFCVARPTFGRDTREAITRIRAWRLGTGALLACAAPIGIYSVINRAFGEGYLPNSILAKTGFDRVLGIARAPQSALAVLETDPALLTLMLIAFAYLAWAATDGPQRNAAIAIVFLTAALLHAFLADIGWFERYQAYLVISGSFVAFRIAAEVFNPERRRRVLVVVLILISTVAIGKAVLLVEVPLAESNTYRQRYQLARFLHRYYDGHAFLTGELGYTTLLHNGAVIDILGLGTYPIAVERHNGVKMLDAQFVERLARERRVRVMAFYAGGPGFKIPKGWVAVAQWHLDEPKISIPDNAIAFLARKGAPAHALERHLRAYQAELPSRVSTLYQADLFKQYIKNL